MTSNNPRQTEKPTKPPEQVLVGSFANFILPAIVALATALAFLPALGNQFVDWDDYENLISNPYYRGLGWSQLRWMFTTFHMGPYQPLSWMTYGLDYLLWGMNPAGYHLTSLLFHGANAVFFYFISRRLLAIALPTLIDGAGWRLTTGAAFAALMFSIHPLRVESVAWATERRDVVSGFFFLATLYCYLRDNPRHHDQPASKLWLGVALGAYVLSLLAKATAMTLPVVLLILDIYPLRRLDGAPRNWWKYRRGILREKLLFAAPAVTVAVVAFIGQQQVSALKSLDSYGIESRLAQVAYGIVFYLWKSILPLGLSPLYELPYDFALWTQTFVLCGVAALGTTIALFLLRRAWPALLACWIYYLAMLAPVLGVAQSGPQLVADRYSYLSCMSWAVLAGGGFFSLWRVFSERVDQRAVLGATLVALLAVCGVLSGFTWRQTKVWHDTRSLWNHVLAVAPQSSIAYYNLGRLLEDENNLDGAIAHYNQALAINPANADAHYNLARLLARQGVQEDAIRHYSLALSIRPNDADAHNNLGLLLALRGNVDAALGEFRKAVRIDPGYSKAFFNIGRLLARQGRLDEAIKNYRRALKLNPDESEVLVGLGDALMRRGQSDEAVIYLQKAARLKPDLADAHVALARALAAQGKKAEAEKHYQAAVRLLRAKGTVTSNQKSQSQQR